jgi:hypothetical protein
MVAKRSSNRTLPRIVAPDDAADWPGCGFRGRLTRSDGEDQIMPTMGNGEYTYEPVENWAKLPPGWSFKEIGSVGVDKNDNVYVFNRGEHPMIVFNRDGSFLRS